MYTEKYVWHVHIGKSVSIVYIEHWLHTDRMDNGYLTIDKKKSASYLEW